MNEQRICTKLFQTWQECGRNIWQRLTDLKMDESQLTMANAVNDLLSRVERVRVANLDDCKRSMCLQHMGLSYATYHHILVDEVNTMRYGFWTVSGFPKRGFCPHPPYSPDVAQSDFKMKIKLKGQRSDTAEDRGRIAGGDDDSNIKRLQRLLPIMSETVSMRPRKLFRRRGRRLGLSVNLPFFYKYITSYISGTFG